MAARRNFLLLSTAAASFLSLCGGKYVGTFVGELQTQVHNVQGKVYIVNERNLYIVNFTYDGEGPDAYFWAGSSSGPSPRGFLIPDERGRSGKLGAYHNKNILLSLPSGKSLTDVRWLSVWSRSFSVNFGHVLFPSNVVIPRSVNLGPLPSLAHNVRAGAVIIQDSKTLFLSRFHYDGSAPDAYFLVGRGPEPRSLNAFKVPDENGRLQPLRGYRGQDLTLHLPSNLTFLELDWFSVYCISFEENFGHVMIPRDLSVPPHLEDLELFEDDLPTSESMLAPVRMSSGPYYGKYIGDLQTNAHDVSGRVYAASEDTFFIENFKYDGQGPEAFFWAGTSPEPNNSGFIVPDELGTMEVLRGYSGQNLVLTLPNGRKIKDIKWLSVWCRRFSVNFGWIKIPPEMEVPKETAIGTFPSFSHGLRSGPVIIQDIKTILISKLYYDGAAPDAFFLVGTGSRPHPEGTKVPDENGSLERLRGYRGKDVVLRLPGNLTVFDLNWLSVYCISYRENFGHVVIPRDINVPADLDTLRASIQLDNCEEIVPEKLRVSWKLTKDFLYLQLEGALGEDEYMAFGRSGNDERPQMIGSDVTVAFYDRDLGVARVVDYFLTNKGQCTRTTGACPDLLLGGSQNVEMLASLHEDGKLRVTFRRPLVAGDALDLSIPTFTPVSLVAAIGPLNSRKEVAFHTVFFTKEPLMINFGRSPAERNCNDTQEEEKAELKSATWPTRNLTRTDTFVAQIGPAGGDKGYTAITGIQSWGVAWWINGYIIPELVVVRGKNYTFVVEGGDDPNRQASYHPFYITNNPEGGVGQTPELINTPDHIVYAGLETNQYGEVFPIGVGRLCEYKHRSGIDMWREVETFEDYNKTLELRCERGEPGIFVWTPDAYTPDLVYYQCFTHRNFGWKIHVFDEEPPEEEALNSSGHKLPVFALTILLAGAYWTLTIA